MKKGKKLGFVTLGLVAMVAAVAVGTMGVSNANKYSDVSTNRVKAFTQVEEQATVNSTQDQETVDGVEVTEEKCAHTSPRKIVVTKEPKCTKNGMTEYRCGDCDALMMKEVTPAIGHKYDENELCENCNEYKTPRLWAEYEINGALYKVTNPLSNGWGNVTLVEQKDKNVTKVDIPKEVKINGENYQITKIGDEAFAGCDKMTKVSMAKEVKTIGKRAFADCDKLKNVEIGKGVEKIEKEAFADCNRLKKIEISKKVKEIGNEAFANCKELKEAEIGNNVKKIGKEAFADCKMLKKVTLGESVEKIGKDAFKDCKSLEKVVIPDSVVSIGYEAFSNCTSLEKVVISDSVESIGNRAFSDCKNLKKVVMPENIKNKGMFIFCGCTKLNSKK
jgi:hypothetical protein